MELNYTSQILQRLRKKDSVAAEDITDFIYFFCKDIQEETGKSAEQCATLDAELLMRRLPWSGRMMMRLLQQHRSLALDEDDKARIDTMLLKIGQIEDEFDRKEQNIHKLEQCQKELEEKNRHLSDIKKTADDLYRTCEELKRKNETLSMIQIPEAKQETLKLETQFQKLDQELKSVEHENESLNQKKRGKEAQLSGIRESLSEQKKAITDLDNEIEKDTTTYKSLLEDEKSKSVILKELENQISSVQKDHERLTQKIKEQSGQLHCFEQQKKELESSLTALTGEKNAFYAEQIQPLKDALQAVQDELAKKETRKTELKQEIKSITSDINKAVLAIGNMDSVEIPNKQQSLRTKEDLFETKKQKSEMLQKKIDMLQKQCDEVIEKLGDLQNKEESLQNIEIPNAQNLYNAAKSRVDELNRQKSDVIHAQKEAEDKIREIQKEMDPITTKLRESTIALGAKRQALTSKNQELARLSRDLDSLNEATSEEELNVLIATANADLERLNHIRSEIQVYKQKCEETDRQISAAAKEKGEKSRELSERQRQLDALKTDISKIEKELEPFADEKYRKRISMMKNRLDQLSKIKVRLKSDLGQLEDSLDYAAVSDQLDDLVKNQLLNSVDLALSDIQETLKSYIYRVENGS